MDILCPSCGKQLKGIGSSGKFFRCPKEQISWELNGGNYGRYLKAFDTGSGYKGPMIADIDKSQAETE